LAEKRENPKTIKPGSPGFRVAFYVFL